MNYPLSYQNIDTLHDLYETYEDVISAMSGNLGTDNDASADIIRANMNDFYEKQNMIVMTVKKKTPRDDWERFAKAIILSKKAEESADLKGMIHALKAVQKCHPKEDGED